MEPPAHKTGAVESEKKKAGERGREGGTGREKRTRKSKGKKTKEREREREVAETKSSPEVETKDLEVHTCSLCVHVMYTLAMVPFPVDISLFRSNFL